MTTTIDTTVAEAVQLWGVAKRYGTGERAVTALDGVTVGFPVGTFTAVMGPSGSGKSTLLHCAAGLDRPSSGKVFVAGTELGPLGEHALTLLRRARVGFVFQAFNLVAALSAEQNVALPLRLAGRRPEPDRVRAALTEMVYASTAANVPPELGGGRTSPSCAWPVPPAGRSCAPSPPSPQWSW